MSDAVPGFHVCEHCDEPIAVESDTCPNCMYTYDDDEPLTADERAELRELLDRLGDAQDLG